MELAKKNWELGSPGIELRSEQTEHFNIMGDAGPKTLEMVATAAEATVKNISSLIRSTGKDAPFRGRITVFVFPKRYGYSEFGKMIESRSIPSDWTGHWQFDGVDAYAATVVGHDALAALRPGMRTLMVAPTSENGFQYAACGIEFQPGSAV